MWMFVKMFGIHVRETTGYILSLDLGKEYRERGEMHPSSESTLYSIMQ